MTKAFSVASWNVKHFGGLRRSHEEIEDIIQFIASQKADIIAIYEVRSSKVYSPFRQVFPNYQFYATEGPQMQEILIGVRQGINTFITQKLEFKSGSTYLRPGVLVTPTIDGMEYPLLFLHLKSLPDPKGFGLRDDMLKRALKFQKTLNDREPNTLTNYIFLGDLNTMGFDYPYTAHDISAESELKELDRRARYKKMHRLSKTKKITWWNGNDKYAPGSNLDHVVAANHLEFKQFDGMDVSVRGWPQRTTDTEKRTWIDKYSDHALLYFEVQKV